MANFKNPGFLEWKTFLTSYVICCLMTLIETIQNQKDIRRNDLKTVKNASIFQHSGVIYCRHYDTVIFAYDINNQKCEVLMNLSMTSNRQIKYLIEGLSIPESIITDLNKNEQKYDKWSFGGSL